MASGKKLYWKGKRVSCIQNEVGKVGIQICWDLAFPEVTRQLAINGADIIFCQSFWSEGDNPLYREFGFSTESIFVDSCVVARAFENELVFVFVNRCGYWQLDEYVDKLIGHTQIALPFYGSLSKLLDEEAVLVQDVDFSPCNKAREIYSIIKEL